MLYTETDLEESMDKIETINFHEVKEVAGIKFWCYHAGHVLGAAMFMIEIAGVKVRTPEFYVYPFFVVLLTATKRFSPLQLLYTGDFSRQEDRHLMAAEIPSVKPDILIIVCHKPAHNKCCLKWIFGQTLVFFYCRSRPMALTSTRRGRSAKLGSVTLSMTLLTEKAAA